MEENKFAKKITGTRADIAAGVEISKVHGGYFSSKKNVEEFIRIGIEPIEKNLPKELVYLDYGGGEGILSEEVSNHLISKGHKVKAIVVDANPKYLEVAKGRGLFTELSNIQESKIKSANLITMRAVIHYNNQENQQGIFNKVFQTLTKGGYLVNQVSSGSKENCELRSAIVNIPSLGRAVSNEVYRWTSESDCIEMLKKAGFKENVLAGYAPKNDWSPEEQWDRFNKNKTEKARENKDEKELKDIKEKMEKYLKEANKLIESYTEKFSNSNLGVIKKDETYTINYTYPIIISRK